MSLQGCAKKGRRISPTILPAQLGKTFSIRYSNVMEVNAQVTEATYSVLVPIALLLSRKGSSPIAAMLVYSIDAISIFLSVLFSSSQTAGLRGGSVRQFPAFPSPKEADLSICAALWICAIHFTHTHARVFRRVSSSWSMIVGDRCVVARVGASRATHLGLGALTS